MYKVIFVICWWLFGGRKIVAFPARTPSVPPLLVGPNKSFVTDKSKVQKLIGVYFCLYMCIYIHIYMIHLINPLIAFEEFVPAKV